MVTAVVTRARAPRTVLALVALLVLPGCPLEEVRRYDDMTPDAGPGTAPELVDLAISGSHGCAVGADGRVYCWGSNSDGALGVEAAELTFRTRPGVVPGITGVVDVVTGSGTCARVQDGTVSCWGEGSGLGDGVGASRGSPAPVLGVANALALSVTSNRACALVAGGLVLCWGSNSLGLLGDGPQGDSVLTPAALTSVSGATSILRGDVIGCATLAGGAASCWGWQNGGVLGNGESAEVLVRAATPVTGLSGATQIVAGPLHTCARLASGTVSCWGSNPGIVTGTDTCTAGASGAYPCATTPVAIAGLADIVELASGGGHVCARTGTGTVLCWGDNSGGQLGDGSTTASTTPVQVPGVTEVVQLVASDGSTCARRADHEVLCWGGNGGGQLDTEVALTPTPLRW